METVSHVRYGNMKRHTACRQVYCCRSSDYENDYIATTNPF